MVKGRQNGGNGKENREVCVQNLHIIIMVMKT